MYGSHISNFSLGSVLNLMSQEEIDAIGQRSTMPQVEADEGVAELLEAMNAAGALQEMFANRATPLTNEMILTMVRQRMSDIDNQLNLGMQDIQKNADLSAQIAEKQQLLRALRERIVATSGAEGGKSMTAEQLSRETFNINGQILTYDEVMSRLGEPRLEGATVSNAQLDELIRIQDGRAKQVNSGNEMLMLQIQSLTQQRSQVIQLGTSLLKKLAEAEQSITRNI